MEKKDYLKTLIMNILSRHVGENCKISSEALQGIVKADYDYHYHQNLISINAPIGKLDNAQMRALISELRTTPQGCMIVATRKAGGGYFTARDQEELDAFTRSDLNAAFTLMNRINKQRKNAGLLEESNPQIQMKGF